MSWLTIATWVMAENGVRQAAQALQTGASAADGVQATIEAVEADPHLHSVGYGGLPNLAGTVEMDSAFMDGDTLAQGAVAGISSVKHAFPVARLLAKNHINSFLVGQGATDFALKHGFEKADPLTPEAKDLWQKKLQAVKAGAPLTPYDGHDTVGALALSNAGSIAVGTSTSGLFMKTPGRIGDSPLSGSGFYADSEVGAAAATGLGEDIMKGCLSFAIVNLMKQGRTPQQACDEAVYPFAAQLQKRYGKVGELSLIALNRAGQFGAATNVPFSFVVASSDQQPTVYLANPGANGTTEIEKASADWLQKERASRKA